MQTLFILGRQPALGLAELESRYGYAGLHPLGAQAALLESEPGSVDFGRLGGSVKAGSLLATFDTTEWRDIERYLIQQLPELAAQLPAGKLTIGLSVYGLKATTGTVNATGLSVKKAIRKASDRSVRLVPNNELELSSAQVFHNGLNTERGWELLVVSDGSKTYVARSFAVQDIDAYTLRDRSRPKRDARVGMLPPKLAQTIINLAVGESAALGPKSSDTSPLPAPSSSVTVLDPFCGTGVVLQEALLMGYDAYGTDLEPRMIEYTGENLDWLADQYDLSGRQMRIETGDATNHTWDPRPAAVAGEAYLGKPFTSRPDPASLAKTVSEVDFILKKFLKNIRGQLKPRTRLCLAVPAWQTAPNRFRHLPLVDQIGDLGYNRIRFEHVRDDQLLYYREDQIVARQLLVLETK